MVGDERLPKSPILSYEMPESARTGGIEAKREFSTAPAPILDHPPDPESENPARTAIRNGVNANDQAGRHDQVDGSRDAAPSLQDLKAFKRIKGRIIITSSGCWEWQGYRDVCGYGRVVFRKRQWQAHRATYTVAIGEIAAGMFLHHLCLNQSCCNPLHLEQVTPQENTRRNLSPPSCNARKTSCDHGHRFTPQNTYLQGGKRRQCRACNSAAVRRYKARKNGGAS